MNPILRIRELAEKMHEYFCKYNHTDGCAFPYEGINGWNGYEHQKWFNKARILYDKYGEQAFDIIETLKIVENTR